MRLWTDGVVVGGVYLWQGVIGHIEGCVFFFHMIYIVLEGRKEHEPVLSLR